MTMYSKYMLTSAIIMAASLPAQAQEDASQSQALNNIDIITVVGTSGSADQISGSVTFIGPEELKLHSYSDVNRVLRSVPGVNLQEEDGYGLRPNIGLRGSGAERSSKIVIMEDGVLMAPAPYAAPSAYYFPMAARMNAVEVSKGPATIKYGPNTTAGAIQLFSTPIPQSQQAYARVFASDQNRQQIHAWAGTRFDAGAFDAGIFLETYQDYADGFKTIPKGQTGFDIQDYVLKAGLYSKDGGQSLEFKIQHKDETANETYLGITQSDFDRAPFARYAASQLDQLNSDHQIYQATHSIDLTDDWTLTTIAYRTEFARNWFKLHDLPGGRSGCTRLSAVLSSPTTCDTEIAILKGQVDSADNALRIRANNRAYYAQGVQTALGGHIDTGPLAHNLVISARLHKDEVDRFQDQDGYKMQNGDLVLTLDNAPGTQANRLSSAKALALYAEDRISLGPLDISAGLRMEQVTTMQTRWTIPERLDANISRVRENDYTVWLPALSAKYELTDNLSILGGAHKGFAAPSVGSNDQVAPERSNVYEIGARYRNDDGLKLEAIGYFNDYRNILGDCTNFAACTVGSIGDSNNGGAVDVRGLEVTASADLGNNTNWALPVSVSYTYTDAKFKHSFDSDFEAWGNVRAGDKLPYVAPHQLTLTAGIDADKWGLNTALNYVANARSVAGQGAIPEGELIGARALLDLSGFYNINDALRLHIKAENLTNKTYAAARRPAGLRPGKPREVFIGASVRY